MPTANIMNFERSLESVRALPESLVDKDIEISTYFLLLTNAFERTFVAAQAISTGAVKVRLDLAEDKLLVLAGLLRGANSHLRECIYTLWCYFATERNW